MTVFVAFVASHFYTRYGGSVVSKWVLKIIYKKQTHYWHCWQLGYFCYVSHVFKMVLIGMQHLMAGMNKCDKGQEALP